jgi:hypothetical protein
MSDIKRTGSCPLGHTCEKIVDGVIDTCNWYVTIAGDNPQTGEPMEDKGCAIAWAPILMIETAREMRTASASVNSLRNEMTKRIDHAMGFDDGKKVITG